MRLFTAVFWITLLSGILIGVSVMRLAPDNPPIPPLPVVLDVCPESMTCYEPYGAFVVPQYILSGSIVLIDWVDESAMPDDTEAYAKFSVDFDANLSWCIITTVIPEQVLGDPKMDALGHELLHCLVGDFHP